MKVFRNIGKILTLASADQKQGRGITEDDLSIVGQAAIVEAEGSIRWVGPEAKLNAAVLRQLGASREFHEVDLKGRTVLPAFVECHTHLVFAGDRKSEFEWRNQGVSYQEIHQKGGGIQSTVVATRTASLNELSCLGQERLNQFIKQGVTTCEVKSGYGLSQSDELKMLEVIRQLRGARIVSTYLGPHSIPKDLTQKKYQQQILSETLPLIAQQKLADRVDIFIENGFYDLEFAKQYLALAKDLGFSLTAHVEQLSYQGGALLAESLGAHSVDHLVQLKARDQQFLGDSTTVAVLLPGADFYLKMAYPDARGLIDKGARVAVATDFNPGSCPTQDLSLIGVLSRMEMKMSLAELIVAYTLNGAAALGLESEIGSIVPGKSCDFIVLDDEWQDLFYSVGRHPVQNVYSKGQEL